MNAKEWLKKGNKLADQEKHEEAIQAYDEAIKLNPAYAAAWYAKGYSLAELDRHEEAIQAYDQAITLDPEDVAAWFNKGYSLAAIDQHEEAIQAYDQAIILDPEDADAWFNQGVSFAELNRHEEAIQAYDQAIKLAPEDTAVWHIKGISLGSLDQHEKAIKVYNQAIRLNPEYAAAWYAKGYSLAALDQHEKAIQVYDQAINLDPKDADAWFNKGYSLVALEKHEEAIQAYDQAIKLFPEYSDAWFNIGEIYEFRGKYKEAVQIYKEAIISCEKNEDLRLALANLYLDLGDFQNTNDQIYNILEKNEEQVSAINLRGKSRLSQNKYTEAHKDFLKAYQMDIGNPVYRLWLIYNDFLRTEYEARVKNNQDVYSVIREMERMDTSVKRMEKSEKREKIRIYILYFLGNLYIKVNDVTAAMEKLHACCNIQEKKQKEKLGERLKFKNKTKKETPTKDYAKALLVNIWEYDMRPPLWKWWLDSPYCRGVKRFIFFLLSAIIAFLLIAHPFMPNLLKELPYFSDINWALYTMMIAILLGVLLLPGVKTFKAGGVEVVMPPLNQFEPVLSPSIIEDRIKKIEKLPPESSGIKKVKSSK